MAALTLHAIIFLVVNTLVVSVWVLLGDGSVSDLQAIVRDPEQANQRDFWPIYLMLFWAAALLIHAGAVVSFGLFGRRARRRRREMARKAAKEIKRHKQERHGRRDAPVRGRQWVVVMFTDLSSSTPLTESMGDEAWTEILQTHRAMVRECVAAFDGTEVNTQGDGFLVRFDDPDQAINGAIDLQRRHQAAREAGSGIPTVRVGIHAGEAVQDEDDDLVGRVINLAARVVDAAQPGEILVTEPVADHASTDHPIVDRGLQPLKGVTRPRHLLGVVWQDGADVPIDELIDLTDHTET